MSSVSSAQIATCLRILVVEDHADSAMAITRLLKSSGFQPQVARTMRNAIELTRLGCFDLLISDIRLPDGSGLDLMRQLRDISTIKGIAMSGLASEDDHRDSVAAGFSAHLGKPLNFQSLLETIDQVCPR